MPSDLLLYPAVVLFLLTASELPLPVLWLPCPLPEDAFQSYPAEASPDTLNFDGLQIISAKKTILAKLLHLLTGFIGEIQDQISIYIRVRY